MENKDIKKIFSQKNCGGVTRTWCVWGMEGHRQRESFAPSQYYDWSEEGHIRIVEVVNSDITATNAYTIVRITRNTAEECEDEFDGQLSDGIFENSRFGKIEEISNDFNDFIEEISAEIKISDKSNSQSTKDKVDNQSAKTETKYVYSYLGEFISEEEARKLASDTTVIYNDGKTVKLKYFDTVYVFNPDYDWNGYDYALKWIINEDGDAVRLDAQYHRSAYEVLREEYELSDEDCESPICFECIGYYIM